MIYRSTSILLSLLLVLGTAPVLAAGSSPSAATACAAGGSAHAHPSSDPYLYSSPDGNRLVRLVSGRAGLAVERLRGTRAFQHLQDLRTRNPKRFARLGTELADRGYEPTQIVVVERTLRLATPADFERHGFPVPEQFEPQRIDYSESNSEGEVIFWSWDDGDDGTWEGSFYAERYSDGAWVSYDSQEDIQTEDSFVIWDVKTGGGGGFEEENRDVSLPGRPGPSGGLVLTSSPGAPSAQLHSQPEVRFAAISTEWRTFWECWIAGCTGCTLACVAAGPGYVGCVGWCCAGVAAYCALDTFWF